MTFVIAVTGSVASGKSTAVKFFANKGISIISADDINRELLKPNTATFATIVAHFGADIVTSEGQLNKQLLRDIIFANVNEKKWLEGLLHPIIRSKMAEQITKTKGPYAIVEIPLLKSKDNFPYIKRVLLIEVDETIQINRLMVRDKCSYEQAKAIINNHTSNAEKRKIADDIVTNNTTEAALSKQLEALHRQYIDLAKTESS